MSSRHATFFALLRHAFLLSMTFFIDKNLEISSKLFKFANDNLLLTIGG